MIDKPNTPIQCPDKHLHTDSGIHESDYLGWHDWADKMSKTHRQTTCPTCGFWCIWTQRDVEPRHRFIEASEELAAKVSEIRGKKGRTLIRGLHKDIGPLLDELDAAYARWLKGEPGGRL